MKYGESTFDILYLLFAILTGLIILVRHRNKADKLMGTAALVLGLGDAFHLVPRVLNYFIDKDFTFYLGLGKLVTSITMTVFYIFIRTYTGRKIRALMLPVQPYTSAL